MDRRESDERLGFGIRDHIRVGLLIRFRVRLRVREEQASLRKNTSFVHIFQHMHSACYEIQKPQIPNTCAESRFPRVSSLNL